MEVIINIFRREFISMKSENMNRKVFAAATALTLAASALALSVSAINYGDDPDYPNPDTGSYSGGGSYSAKHNPSKKTEEGKSEASILTADTVGDAITNVEGNKITVEMAKDKNGNLTLMEDTIAAIAGSNVEVTVDVQPDSKGDLGYSVGIDPAKVKDIKGSVNIGMKVYKVKKMSSVDDIKVPSNAVIIKPKASGDFGVTLKVTVPKSAFEGMTASKIRPYAISGTGKNKKVVMLPDDAYTVNDDGSITILIDSGDATIAFSDKDIAKAAEKHGLVS